MNRGGCTEMEAAIWLVVGSTAMYLGRSLGCVDLWSTGELDLAALCPAS